MAVSKAHHTGYGLLNQNFPVWDFGAFVYWQPRLGVTAQLRGGVMTTADDFVYTYSGAAVSGEWAHFAPGKGHYSEEAFPPPNIIPLDGHFQSERLNTWNTSDGGSDRGPWTREAGISLVLITPAPAPHIIQYATGSPPGEVPAVTNATGSVKRMYRLETTSSGDKTMFSVLFRRSDGAKVDSSTVTIGAAAAGTPFGADLGELTTRYDKIRSDGWYRVSRSIPDQTGANVNYFADIQPGISNLRYESPQVEIFNTTIAEPTAPIITGGASSQRRNKHLIELQGNYRLSKFGWMGCTIIPYTNAAALVAGPSPGLIQGDILTWFVDSNNRNRFIWSATSNTIKFLMTGTSTIQADLVIPQAEVLQGVSLGMVATWGSRNGDNYVMLAVNGTQKDLIDIVNTPPEGTASIFIGADDTGGSVANCMVQRAAFGSRALNRNDVRTLSRWFQTQGFSTLEVAGS